MIDLLHIFENAAVEPFTLSAIGGMEASTPIGTPAPVVQGVSGLRPMGTATFDFVSGYETISAITVTTAFGSVALTNIVETGPNQATADCPRNMLDLIGATVQVEVTDANGTSDPFNVTLEAPDGFSVVDFTSIEAGSIASGISGLSVGNEGVYLNPANGQAIVWNPNGEMDAPGAAPGSTHNVSYYIIDHTDGVASDDPIGVINFTIPSGDNIPDNFTFSDVTGAEPSTQYQDVQPITGVDEGATLNVTNGELSNDNGATWAASVTMVAGQTLVRATLNSSPSYNGAETTVLVSVNGISDTLNVTTRNAVAPTVDTHPTTQTVASGDSVTLVSAFTGANSIQWYRNGVVIAGATSASYTFNAAYANNGDTYYAIATGEGGTTTQTNTATLTVTPLAPTVTTHPSTQSIAEGGAVTLVSAFNNASSIQWYKGGEAISGETGASLTIDPVALADSGDYYAVATGEGGATAQTNTATLTVNVAVSDSIVTPKERTIYVLRDGSVSYAPLFKDPLATLDFKVDLTQLLGGDTIVSASFSEQADIEIASQAFNATSGTVMISGGADFKNQEVVFSATTALGRTHVIRFYVRIVSWVI